MRIFPFLVPSFAPEKLSTIFDLHSVHLCEHVLLATQPLMRILHVCQGAGAVLSWPACVCGLMIDDEHNDKSSNHPASELKAQWLLFLKSGTFSCVWVRKQMTFVYMSHQHPLAQLSIHQDVLWQKFVYVCIWPFACYYGTVSACVACVNELPSMCDILN